MNLLVTYSHHKDPIEFRRYVSFLADNTPPAPPEISKDESRAWQHSYLRTPSSYSLALLSES